MIRGDEQCFVASYVQKAPEMVLYSQDCRSRASQRLLGVRASYENMLGLEAEPTGERFHGLAQMEIVLFAGHAAGHVGIGTAGIETGPARPHGVAFK